MYGEVQGMFHINHQQDTHDSLLKILDIYHNHAITDIFPCLAFLQEVMKYTSIIRNPEISIVY